MPKQDDHPSLHSLAIAHYRELIRHWFSHACAHSRRSWPSNHGGVEGAKPAYHSAREQQTGGPQAGPMGRVCDAPNPVYKPLEWLANGRHLLGQLNRSRHRQRLRESWSDALNRVFGLAIKHFSDRAIAKAKSNLQGIHITASIS